MVKEPPVLRVTNPSKRFKPAVVASVKLPVMSVVPVTVKLLPTGLKVDPGLMIRFPLISPTPVTVAVLAVERVRSFATVRVEPKVIAPADLSKVKEAEAVAAPVKVTAPAPDMVCAPLKATAPAPVWLKAPAAAIPPLNSNGAVLLTENVPEEMVTNPSNLLSPPATVEMVVPVEDVVPKTVNVPVWVMVVVSVIARDCRVMFPAPLTVIFPNVVRPAPVKSMFPVRIKFPLIVTGTEPALKSVPAPTVTGPNVRAFP